MPIDPVLIRFATAGVADVSKAFDSIEARMIKAEEMATKEAERSSKKRVAVTKDEAAQREKVFEGSTKTRIKAGEAEAKEVDRLEKYKLKVQIESAKMAGHEAEKLANLETREAQRAAKEIERLEQYKQRVRIRSSEMAMRASEEEARAEERARERVSRGIGHSVTKGVGHSIGTAASLAGGALAIGGGFALADAAHQRLEAQKTAALIVNEVTIGGKVAPGATVGNILSRSGQVAKETGMSLEDVQAGMLTYTRSAKGGDFNVGMENMGFFAKLSKTTGTDITEIAKGAGVLQSENPNLKGPEMRQMMLDIMEQGHQGSIPLAEMAGLAGVVGSARGAFAGDTTVNQRKLLGLTQLGRGEAGGSEEAARGLKQMALEIERPKHAATLRGWGVKYTADGQVESPEQMISAAIHGSGNNLQKLGEIFGARSGGLMRHLSATYREAGGGDAGQAAVTREMASVTQAHGSEGSLEAQFQQLMTTPAEKFQKALNDLSVTAGERLEPVMAHLADALVSHQGDIETLMNSIIGLAEWFVANPWTGIGAAVSLSITKEIASAAIGEAVKRLIAGSVSNGNIMIATATLAIGAIAGLIDAGAAAGVAGQRRDVGATLGAINDISNVNANVRAGKVTPADIAKIQADIAEKQGALDRLNNPIWGGMPAGGGGGLFPHALGYGLGDLLTGDKAGQRAHDAQVKAATDDLRRLGEALKAATNAAYNAAGGTANVDPARHVPIGSPGR